MGRIKRGGGDGGDPVRSPPGWSYIRSAARPAHMIFGRARAGEAVAPADKWPLASGTTGCFLPLCPKDARTIGGSCYRDRGAATVSTTTPP
jgi:hypothetical protein